MKYRIFWTNKYNSTCGHGERTYEDRNVAQSFADEANDTDASCEYWVEMVSDASPVAHGIIENQKNLVHYDTYDWNFSLN